MKKELERRGVVYALVCLEKHDKVAGESEVAECAGRWRCENGGTAAFLKRNAGGSSCYKKNRWQNEGREDRTVK